jgi:hypothetical protein
MNQEESQNLYDKLVGRPLSEEERSVVINNLVSFYKILIEIDEEKKKDF